MVGLGKGELLISIAHGFGSGVGAPGSTLTSYRMVKWVEDELPISNLFPFSSGAEASGPAFTSCVMEG